MSGAVPPSATTTSVVRTLAGVATSITKSMGRKKQRSGGGHPGPLSEGRVRIVGLSPYLYCCLLINRNPLLCKSTKSKNFLHHTALQQHCQNGSDCQSTAGLALSTPLGRNLAKP